MAAIRQSSGKVKEPNTKTGLQKTAEEMKALGAELSDTMNAVLFPDSVRPEDNISSLGQLVDKAKGIANKLRKLGAEDQVGYGQSVCD